MMYVYEFLYRGRSASEGQSPSYHVILGDEVEQFGETKLVFTKPLTPSQAQAMGFDLGAIVADINTSVMAERDALRAEKAALVAQVAALEAARLANASNG